MNNTPKDRIPDFSAELVIEIAAEGEDFSSLEDTLSGLDGIRLRELNPYEAPLNSNTLHTLIIAASSTGVTSAASAVLIQFIKSRRAKVTVRRNKDGMSVTFEGPLQSQREIERFVNSITPHDISN